MSNVTNPGLSRDQHEPVGGTVEVPTSEFRALVGQVAELAEAVRNMTAEAYCASAVFAAGRETGKLDAIAQLIDGASPPKGSRLRPRHLRALGDDAS